MGPARTAPPALGTKLMDLQSKKDRLIRRRIVVGTASNYAGQILAYATLFFLTPFILRQLGPAAYGLWVLVGSIVAYGSLLDLGIWGAVIKYVSEFLARDQHQKARHLVSTALWLYVFLGLGVLTLAGLIAPFVPALFSVAPGQETHAVQLTLLMGLATGLSLPAMAPLAALRGLQRYELVNLAEAVGTLFTAAATVAALLTGGGVVSLVIVNIFSMLLMHVLALRLSGREAGGLNLGWQRPRRAYVRLVLGYSWPLFIKDVANRLQTKTDELTIGALLVVTAVTPYNLARRLSDATHVLTRQFMKVLLPLASELDAENDHGRLRLLYTTGTRLSVAISMVIGVSVMVMARPILVAWIGPEYGEHSSLVIILTAANLIATSQWPAMALLQGTTRHRLLAATAFTSGIANLALSILLVRPLGLVGVALGTLIPTALEHLGIIMPYTMRRLKIGKGEALRRIYVPALLPAAPMALVQIVFLHLVSTASLLALVAITASGAIVYGTAYLVFGTSAVERQAYRTLAGDVMSVAAAQLRR